MKYLILTLALLAPVAHAETLLTAHPAAEALARRLTDGTAITVQPVQPDRLPASRLHSYLAGRGRDTVETAAKTADAVLTFRSFWPEDPLYPAARRANIRIVEIDAGMPLDQRMPGIALLSPVAADKALYNLLGLEPMPPMGEETAPWLAPTRLGEMAEIVAGDLSRLVPTDAPRIAENLRGLKHELLQRKAQVDEAMALRDDVEFVALSPQFGYLAADYGLDLRARIIAAPAEWTPDRAEALASWMAAQGVFQALSARELPPALADAFGRHGIAAVILDVSGLDGAVEPLLKARPGSQN